jgi:hypothetical protein
MQWSVEDVQSVVCCHWLEQAARQFRAIANLPHGWDSYGSPPPDADKLEAGWRLLLRLCQAGDLPKPHINPTRDGGVQFDWEEGPRYFEIEVKGPAEATYLWCDEAAGAEETGTISEGEPLDAVVAFVRRVGAG